MQSDQIVLAVDAANDSNPANETFSRYQEFENRSVYIGPGHLPEARNMLALYRTFPTRVGNFKGVLKTSVKLTKDMEVAGVDSSTAITSPAILELSFSVPVGVTAANLVHLRQTALALLDDDTFMNSLNIQQVI